MAALPEGIMLRILPLLFALACAKKEVAPAAAAKTTSAAGAADAVAAEADALWLERADELKLREALAKYEQVVAADPSHRQAHIRLTRGWYFWGDGFTTDKAVQAERWEKAVEWGNRCLALNDAFAKGLADGQKERDLTPTMTRADVGCAYWTATSLGKWARTQGIATTLKHLNTVKAYITRVEELQPDYFNYGPARYWGAYNIGVPFGKDPEKSAQYFQASIDGAPWYLATRTLRAEFLWTYNRDRARFEEDLRHVIDAEANANPEADVGPENIRERIKAKELLARAPELFE